MHAMIYAGIAIVVIAVGSNILLGNAGFSAEERAAGPAVRLDN